MNKIILPILYLLILLGPSFSWAQSCDDPLSSWIPDYNDPVLTVKTKLIFVQDENGNGNFNSSHNAEWIDLIDNRLSLIFANIDDPIIGGVAQNQMQWYQDAHIRFSLDPADIVFVQSAEHWDPLREFVGDILSTNTNEIVIAFDDRNEIALNAMVNYNNSNSDKMWMEIRGGSSNDGLYSPNGFTIQNNEITISIDQNISATIGQGIADFDCPITKTLGGNNGHADNYAEFGEDKLTHLNILFTGRSFYYPTTNDYGQYWPIPIGNGGGGHVVLNDYFNTYQINGFLGHPKLLAHEIGHVLGLNHTHNGVGNQNAICTSGLATDGDSSTGVTDTPDDFGCNCDPDETDPLAPGYNVNCSNNQMGYNINAGYFSPLQAAKMYSALSCGNLYYFTHPCSNIIISTDETIDVPTTVCANLIVEAGATLTIDALVSFNKDSKLIVRKGGKLILNSHLTHIQDMWQGIEIEGSAYLDQSLANQGMVIINSNGWIRNARTGIRNHLRNDQGTVLWNTTGGIIQANGGNFRDNRKNVVFLSYHGTGNTFSSSYFNDTRFTLIRLRNSDYDNLPATELVSIYNVDGVQFSDCWFVNFSPSYSSLYGTGTGLALHSADVDLEATTFENLNIGLQATNSDGEVFFNNIFKKNKTAIKLSDSNIVYIKNNSIDGPSNPDFDTNKTTGIEVTNVTRLHLEDNDLTLLTNGINVDHTGPDYNSNVSGNSLADCLVSLVTKNDNSRLFIRCNKFQGAAGMSTHWINNGVMNDQGTCTSTAAMNDPASNVFTGVSPPNSDIFNLGDPFRYVFHYFPGSGYTLADLEPSTANSNVILNPCLYLSDPFDYQAACIDISQNSASERGQYLKNEWNMTVFPNPGTGAITLDIDVPEKAKAKSRVFDLTGKMMYTLNHKTLESGRQRLFLDLEVLPPGAYLLEFSLNEQSIIHKLVLTD